MYDLSAFQRDCLYAIAKLNSPQGTAIKAHLDEYYDTEIYHARLYSNLDKLVEKGLIVKGRKDGRTNEYRLTKLGRRVIEARLEWIEA